jgi:molybdopterin biosynthesis enzyme
VDSVSTYVPSEIDRDLREAIAVAAERGGVVLLTGGSSVGRTRAMYEAVKPPCLDVG